ncbi:MAG: restriction endonuclease [Chloroflexi bacterium]|nr:restriction endonuclease [Chloroflexota bacterium]
MLTRLFNACGLQGRTAFRVVGEEIDGSFELDHSVYLVEAKWQREPVSHSQLLVFHGKVGGKSQFTRGVFIALNDVSTEAREAIRQGKRPAFFVMNGYDLMMILTGAIDLVDFLRARRRLLDEQGLVCLPFAELR